MNTTGDRTHSTGLESSLEMAYSYRRGWPVPQIPGCRCPYFRTPHDNPPHTHTSPLSLPRLGVTVDKPVTRLKLWFLGCESTW